MIKRLAILTLLLGSMAVPAAHALPQCVSTVPVAPAASAEVGFFTAHGFGGGQIADLYFPSVSGVVPPQQPREGDVVGALLLLNFRGVLGGGTSTVTPIGGTSLVSTGAEVDTVLAFTGHFKAVPRTYDCASVVTPNTTVRHSYFELSVSGLLTPVNLGSPLAGLGAPSYQIDVSAGDVSPT